MLHLKFIAIALLSIVLSACQIAPLQKMMGSISLEEAPAAKAVEKSADTIPSAAKPPVEVPIPNFPLVERRESLTATGYAVISVQNHKLPAQQRLMAIRAAKAAGRRLATLTAYDYPTARLLDECGLDMLLVGDSLGMVVLGHPDTTQVTMDDMIHHTRAVARGVTKTLVAADLPAGQNRNAGTWGLGRLLS